MHSQRLTDGLLVVIAVALGVLMGSILGLMVVVMLDQLGIDLKVEVLVDITLRHVVIACVAVAYACYAAGYMVEQCLKGRRYQDRLKKEVELKEAQALNNTEHYLEHDRQENR